MSSCSRVSEKQRRGFQPTSLDIEDEPISRSTALPVYQDVQYDVDSRTSSPPPAYDVHNIHGVRISSLRDDDDDDEIMALGDEAMNSLLPAVSDDDEQLVRDNNVSPIMDHVSNVPELINQKPLRTPPATPSLMTTNPTYENDDYPTNNNNRHNTSSSYYSTQYQSNYDDVYDNYHSPAISNMHTVSIVSLDRCYRSLLCLSSKELVEPTRRQLRNVHASD